MINGSRVDVSCGLARCKSRCLVRSGKVLTILERCSGQIVAFTFWSPRQGQTGRSLSFCLSISTVCFGGMQPRAQSTEVLSFWVSHGYLDQCTNILARAVIKVQDGERAAQFAFLGFTSRATMDQVFHSRGGYLFAKIDMVRPLVTPTPRPCEYSLRGYRYLVVKLPDSNASESSCAFLSVNDAGPLL